MATLLGVQFVLSSLFSVPGSCLQGVARELNCADLRPNTGRNGSNKVYQSKAAN